MIYAYALLYFLLPNNLPAFLHDSKNSLDALFLLNSRTNSLESASFIIVILLIGFANTAIIFPSSLSVTGFIMVLCHQSIGLSPTQLNYPLSSRVNTKFLRCQYNGNKHLMFRTLFKQEKTFLLVFIVYSKKLKTSTISLII